MRELLLLLMLGMLARGQVLHGPRGAPPHRPLFPGASPFSQGLQSKSEPQQGVGQLPLNPRPTFEEDFRPQEDEGFFEDEVALQGGDFSPLFSDEEPVEPARENADHEFAQEPQGHSSPSTPPEETEPDEGIVFEGVPLPEEPTQPKEEQHDPQVTTQQQRDHSQVTTLQQEEPQLQQPPYQPSHRQEPPPESLEEQRYPERQFSGVEETRRRPSRHQYEQETQDVLDIISLPRPIHRPNRWQARPRPQYEAAHRRPTHPNQLPLYNVIGEEELDVLDSQEAETRERPVQVAYQYDDEYLDEEEEEDEDEEEPDRLAILLLDSRFNCLQKNNGYYADEEVDCEVFHYCQDSVKHSWLCPEGASFHQVHLICMPRSEDNICAKSSKFHFVNDFLYKELQPERGANKTYADRYYPEGFEFGVADVDTSGKVAAAQAPQRHTPAYGGGQVAQQRPAPAYAGGQVAQQRPAPAYAGGQVAQQRPPPAYTGGQVAQQRPAPAYSGGQVAQQRPAPAYLGSQVGAPQVPARPAVTYVNHPSPSRQTQQPLYQEDLGDPYVVRRPQQFARPQHFTGSSQGFARQPTPFRTTPKNHENLEQVLALRRPG